jgi:branched-chain amino acid transport system permease protein
MAKSNQTGHSPASAIKDILFWGVVAIGLFGPIVGFETVSDNTTQSTILQSRWMALAAMVVAVMVIRALVMLYHLSKGREHGPSPLAAVGGVLARWGTSRVPLFLGLGFAIVFPILTIFGLGPNASMKWISNYGIIILIYIMLGWGLNIVVGLAGLLDLGYVAFYAVGAYTYAILSTRFGLSFWILLPLGGILAAFWGIILGFPVLRLRGDYLAIVTLAFGEIIRIVLINWEPVTGGPAGINEIPQPTLFGIPFNTSPQGFAVTFGLPNTRFLSGFVYPNVTLYYIVLVLVLITAVVSSRLRRLPVGRAWEALREDEIACRSLGVDTTKTKLAAFATGAMFGGLAGVCFAARQTSVSPESFVFMESVMVLSIVVLGGSGSLLGVVIAAIAMQGGLELLRELSFLKQIFGNDFDPDQYRYLIFGLAMVLMMLWRPRGLISSRSPTAFLRERRVVSGDLVKEGHG